MSPPFMDADTQLPDRSIRLAYPLLRKCAKEIRLVQIRPKTNDEDTIRLSMKHVNLDDYGGINYRNYLDPSQRLPQDPRSERSKQLVKTAAKQEEPVYRALSYVWGTETPSYDVFIESRDTYGWLSVRANLHDYLQTWQRESDQSTWFWIDQICIDQRDTGERGHQVNLMSEIYVRAAEVVVWLGLGFEGSDAAMTFIADTASSCIDVVQHTKHEPTLNTNAETELLKRRADEHLPALLRIVRLSYWSRLWITQEVLLGDKVTIRLGDETTDFTTQFRPAFPSKLHPLLVTASHAGWRSFPDLLWRVFYFDNSLSWDDAYDIVRMKRCDEVRDMAFGVLGIIDPRLRFYPDYAMDVQEILLSILRLQLSLQTDFPSVHIQRLALFWHSILDPERRDIRVKPIRDFLLHEAHPALRQIHRQTLEEGDGVERFPRVLDFLLRVLGFLDDSIGYGPSWIARMRLRWMFPNNHSPRWHFKFARGTLKFINVRHEGEDLRPACRN